MPIAGGVLAGGASLKNVMAERPGEDPPGAPGRGTPAEAALPDGSLYLLEFALTAA